MSPILANFWTIFWRDLITLWKPVLLGATTLFIPQKAAPCGQGAQGSCSVQSRWSGIGRPVIMVKHLFHTVKVGHTGCENVMSKV